MTLRRFVRNDGVFRSFGVVGNPYTGIFLSQWGWSWTAFAGLMIAPSRGLLIFSPILLFALYGFVHYVGERRATGLDFAYGAYVLLLWMFMACWPDWWGGRSYGPRMMSDPLPFLMLYVAVAWDAMAARADRLGKAGTAAFLLLIAVSVFMHGRGAISRAAYAWNPAYPNLDTMVWSITNPQALYGLHHSPAPEKAKPSKPSN